MPMFSIRVGDFFGMKVCSSLHIGKKDNTLKDIVLTPQEAEKLLSEYKKPSDNIKYIINNYNIDKYALDQRKMLIEKQIFLNRGSVVIDDGSIIKLEFDLSAMATDDKSILMTNTRSTIHGNIVKTLELFNSVGEFEFLGAKFVNSGLGYMNFIHMPSVKPSEDQKRVLAELWLEHGGESRHRKLGNNVCMWAFEGESPESISRRYGNGKKVFLA